MPKCAWMPAVALVAATAVAAPYGDGDTVVFFGDSITHGGYYHKYIADYYRTRFPDASIRFVNSGIGGDTAEGAFKRIPEDVADYAPTHVAFHFGMNDINRGSYLLESTSGSLKERDRAQRQYRASMRRLVEGVRQAAPQAKFTYLTPTPYDDTAVVTNAPKSGWASVNQVGCNTGLSLMAGYVLASAAEDGAETVDWYSLLNSFMRRHQKEDPHFSFVAADRVHPGPLGHSIMVWEFLRQQGAPAVVSEVEIDAAATNVVKTENCAVSDFRCVDRCRIFTFTLLEKALPMPVHEQALPYLDEFGVEDALNRETVKVAGLIPRKMFMLSIDDKEVGQYSSEQFAAGVRLGFNTKTPQYRQAQEVASRSAVLWDRERLLRDHHSARWYFAEMAPVDDMTAFRTYYETEVVKPDAQEWVKYFGAFIPGYLEYWPRHREIRAKLWREQEAVRKLAKPVPHKYKIVMLSHLTLEETIQ